MSKTGDVRKFKKRLETAGLTVESKSGFSKGAEYVIRGPSGDALGSFGPRVMGNPRGVKNLVAQIKRGTGIEV